MTMPSTCHMRGSPPVQVFQFILMASDLSYWFAMSFIIHQAFLITSNVNLTKKEKKKKKKKKRLFWLSLSGATNWVLAPPVDGISTVSNLITPLDSYNSYISFFFFQKNPKTNKQTNKGNVQVNMRKQCMHAQISFFPKSVVLRNSNISSGWQGNPYTVLMCNICPIKVLCFSSRFSPLS